MFRAIGSLIWAAIRGGWWLLLAMWTQPVPRLLLALAIAWWGWSLWWVAVIAWGDPVIVWWPWVAGVAAGLLVASAASAIHHIAPQGYRPLAIGRTVAYAIALVPIPLAVGTWVGGLTVLGHALGIVAELVLAAGLGLHAWYGPEIRN